MSAWYGYQNTETWGIVLDNRTTDPVENYYNTDSPLWRMAEFYYKQNQAGILDPDTLIARERSELAAKMAKGQYVGMTIRAGGFARAWDAIHAKEGRGLVAVPIEGGGIWGGQDLRFGSANFRTISAKAQDKIEAVMRLFDWGFSEHGMRTLSTGVEGIHWDFVDGKGSVRQMTLDLRAAGGEDWSATGIDMLGWGGQHPGIHAFRWPAGAVVQHRRSGRQAAQRDRHRLCAVLRGAEPGGALETITWRQERSRPPPTSTTG